MMRMHHFEDQYGHFFFGKNVFALCIALFYHKKYEENCYQADIKKAENLWNSIQKFCKILSFKKFISAKNNPPQKLISSVKNLFNLCLTELEV